MHRIIVCPMCQGQLVELACTRCHATYKKKSGVPSFITRDMYPTEGAYADALRVIDFWGHRWDKRLAEPDHERLLRYIRTELGHYADRQLDEHRESDSIMGVDLSLDTLKGQLVVNVGCGAGGEALLLVHGGAECVAIDITTTAARAANELIQRSGGKGFGIQADSRFLPVATDSVDAVYSSGVLHHSPDIARSIAQIYRVFRPGGKAYIMLYATWSVLFVQQRLMFSMGEGAWETGVRKNPFTTTYTKRECRRMFAACESVRIRKTGENLRHLARIGRFMPASFDRVLYPFLGPRLNIVAEKARS